jgi:parvulin-like peptidyl-prolyl isomerase
MKPRSVLNNNIKMPGENAPLRLKFLLSYWQFFFFIFLACAKPEQQKTEGVVARVGSEVLTVADLAQDIPDQIRQHISKAELQDYVVRWIDSQTLYQEAKKRQLDQSESVRRELRRLERELVVNALLEQELNKSFAISDQEIEKYYQDNRQAFTRDINEVHVQHIKVGNKKSADSLTAALRSGGDFLQAARYFDADSADFDLYLTEAETPPAVVSGVFTIMTGAVSRPVALDNGFHIFKMIEKFEIGSLRKLPLVRQEIIAKIQSEKRQERYRQLLAALKNNTPVERNFHLLESASFDSLKLIENEE